MTQPQGITARALAAGFLFSIVLCAMNSYLTLSFGVIEEGPTIAALFFFAIFFLSRTKITTTEMVLVATMGSAGGSLGFISNFYAAKTMTGEPYTLWQMVAFGVVSSLVGLVMTIPLRQLLVLREKLPWPGAKATQSVITSLVTEGDPRQARILIGTFAALCFYVVFNDEDGFKWFPSHVDLPLGMAMVGGVLAISPFAIGGSYLMGFRTCVGFLTGAATLMIMAPYLPLWPVSSPEVAQAALAEPVNPASYYWPGLGFLVSSGLTVMFINWKTIVAAIRSMFALGGHTDDDDPVMPGKALAAFAIVTFVLTSIVLNVWFSLSILLIVVLVVVAGLLQNIIATRAAAQTAFNPARVMGVLLQGVSTALGGARVDVNLTGAGFVAGSGAQAGNLTGDLQYGRWLGVPSRWQFWAQATTVIPCAIVSAYVFEWIRTENWATVERNAPVAKMWAQSGLVFDKGFSALPPGAPNALLIGAVIGVVYCLLEHIKPLQKWMPETIGVGLGLVLWTGYGLSFFLGGFIFWIVLQRWLGVRPVTLTTVAVAAIVAEGIGGVIKPILKLAGAM